MGETGLGLVLGGVSGGLLALAQPAIGIPALFFLAFFPVWSVLKIKLRGPQLWLVGISAALVYFLITFAWLWGAWPLDQLGITNHWAASGLLLLAELVLILPFLPLWGLAFWLNNKFDSAFNWPSAIIFPALFTWFEYLRAWLPSLILKGTDTPLGGYWTIGNPAYALHDSAVWLALSSVVGIYGVLFMALVAGVILFQLYHLKRWRFFWGLAGLLLLSIYLPVAKPAKTGQPVSASILQTQSASQPTINVRQELADLNRQIEGLNQLAKQTSAKQLIVLPENGNFFNKLSRLQNTAEVSRWFARLFPAGATIVDNGIYARQTGTYSRTIILDSQSGIKNYYDKYLITPGAEYLPISLRALLNFFGVGKALTEDYGLKAGPGGPLAIGAAEQIGLIPLVCSDLYAPSLTRAASNNQAEVITVQTSYAFVRGSTSLAKNSIAAAQFRAAENGRYLVLASNYGPSAIINDRGRVIASTNNSDWQLLTEEIITIKSKTLYNTHGDMPILLGCLGVLVIGIFSRPRRHDKNH